MKSLGDLIRELRSIREKKNIFTERRSKTPLKEERAPVIRKGLFTFLLIFLFVGSILAGLYLVRLSEVLKKEKVGIKPPIARVEGQKVSPPPPPTSKVTPPPPIQKKTSSPPTQKNISPPPTSQKTLPPPSLKKTSPSPPLKEKAPQKPTQVAKVAPSKAISKLKPPLKHKEKAREPEPKEKTDHKIPTQSPPGPPPLRELALLENLLLNAEEERRKGNYLEAARLYEDYLRYRPHPDVYNNLGGVYLLLGDLKKALQSFESALKLKFDPQYEINRWIVLLKMGEKEKVCRELKTRSFSPFYEDKIKELREICK